MANKKIYNSKNIAKQIIDLEKSGKSDLAIKILQQKELRNLSRNILNILGRSTQKLDNYNMTKVYTKTKISEDVIENILKGENINSKNLKIIIDDKMSAGIKIKAGDKLIDATYSTMLKNELNKITNQIN